MKTIILAHYYAPQEVQKLADFVGDSLDLSLKAKEAKADRIIFAGVRFMAETAKILNPDAEVILPDSASTCSLVTQTNPSLYRGQLSLLSQLKYLFDIPTTIVTYINSSVELKAASDIIVTSANVEEVIQREIDKGKRVYFTPDRNMGAYLRFKNPQWGKDKFQYYEEAVCEVHDKFREAEVAEVMDGWDDYPKYLLAHPESPLPVLKRADFVGSTSKMLQWVIDYKYSKGTIYVATESGLLYNMRQERSDLDIKQVPSYTGCQCTSCPYMKLNTYESVTKAAKGRGGLEIEIDEKLRTLASVPIERMLNGRL